MSQGRFAEALPLLEKADAFWRGFDADNRWAGEASLWLAQCRRAYRRADKILSKSSLPPDNRLRKTRSDPE